MTDKKASITLYPLRAIGSLADHFVPHRRRIPRIAFTFSVLFVSILSPTGLVLSALFLSTVYAQEALVDPAAIPALVPLVNINAIAAGGSHTCALTTGGGVKCWGNDVSGQVGDGAATGIKITPVNVVGLGSGVQAIAAGGRHTCVLTTGDGVQCWGRDAEGQVGDGADNSNKFTPVDVVGLGSGVQASTRRASQLC